MFQKMTEAKMAQVFAAFINNDDSRALDMAKIFVSQMTDDQRFDLIHYILRTPTGTRKKKIKRLAYNKYLKSVHTRACTSKGKFHRFCKGCRTLLCLRCYVGNKCFDCEKITLTYTAPNAGDYEIQDQHVTEEAGDWCCESGFQCIVCGKHRHHCAQREGINIESNFDDVCYECKDLYH